MFGKTVVRVLLAVALAATTLGRMAMADVILPKGLTPGSKDEIAFVTADSTTAESSSIVTYNNFVTSEANQDEILESLGATWNAIGSTSTVDANVNAPNNGSIPVYNTAGQLVANSAQPLYSSDLYDPVSYTQFGQETTDTSVWTGSTSFGSSYLVPPLGSAGPEYGFCTYTSDTWLYYGPYAGNFQPMGLYALSSPITVVPEPATLTLSGSALLGLGVVYLLRRGAKTIARPLLAAVLVITAGIALSFSASAVRGDTVYAAQFGSGTIDKISSTGIVSTFATGLTYPLAMVFDKAGNLYVACNSENAGQATVEKITPGGAVSTYATGRTVPTALAFDSSGNLYVTSETNETVSKITAGGQVSKYATVGGEPEGLAFDSSGNLFVSTLNADIYKVSLGGTVSLFADTCQEWGTGLAIDYGNDLFMGNDANGICEITPQGTVSTFATGTTQAMNVAMGSNGTPYVADLGSASVKEVSGAGVMSNLATGLTGVQSVAVLVPEPSTLGLLGASVVGLLGWSRRFNRENFAASRRDGR